MSLRALWSDMWRHHSKYYSSTQGQNITYNGKVQQHYNVFTNNSVHFVSQIWASSWKPWCYSEFAYNALSCHSPKYSSSLENQAKLRCRKQKSQCLEIIYAIYKGKIPQQMSLKALWNLNSGTNDMNHDKTS